MNSFSMFFENFKSFQELFHRKRQNVMISQTFSKHRATNYLHLLKPWLELTAIPLVGLWWYDDDERVALGADEGDRRL